MGNGGSDREERGFGEFFNNIVSRVNSPVSLVRGGNSTHGDERGIFDFIGNIANSILGGADDKVSGPVLIPNHCWYRGAQYDCNLATTCVFSGKKPMDLCNGGMIWSCCVDRDKVDYVDPSLGAVSDAQCGKIYQDGQARIVGGHEAEFGKHPWQA